MIYVVLGMHKSGTTLVSQMLHLSGINMGELDAGLGYDDDNKYERHATQELNRRLMHTYQIPPLNYLLRRPFRSRYDQAGYRRNNDSVALVRYSALSRKLRNDPLPNGMRQLVETLSATYGNWGFKDPRTCLTYPAWQRVLPEHKLIIVFRNYQQLLKRYRVSDRNWPRLYRVLNAWTLHNSSLLKILDSTQAPFVVISYEKLMKEDGEFHRLQEFIGQPLQDVRRQDLYRHRATPSLDLPPPARVMKPFLPADPQEVYLALDERRRKPIPA